MRPNGLIGSNASHSIAILDANVLVAVADIDEREHARCVAVLERRDLRVVIPSMVVAEATYLIGRRGGPVAEARFLHAMSQYEVEAAHPDDWERIAELVEKYADFPLGGTNASVIALAERLNTDLIITLDRRHFGAVRPRHVEALRLLPD